MNNRLVITGISVLSSIGVNKDEFWTNLTNGASGIKDITLFDASKYNSKKAGEITDFDAKEYLGKRGIRHIDRTSLLVSSAAKLAMEDANITHETYGADELGIVIGSTYGSIDSISSFDLEGLKEGPTFVNPMEFPNTVLNAPASRVSIFCNATGLNSTISTGTASGLDAIIYASDFLRLGRGKAVVAGGVHGLTPDVFWGAYRSGILSGSRNGDIEISAPFDKRRNGFVIGEAAALLVIERLEDALERNTKIYAEIKGYGCTFNPDKVSRDHIDTTQGARCISIAMKDAGINAEDISYISACANSSITGDIMEARIIKDYFGDNADKIPVSAIKSMTGECLDASGSLQCVAGVLAINNGIIPPTINYQEKDEECNLDCVPNNSRESKVNNVLINSFSDTGNISAVIISKYS
ncbi:MAG: beta-ketoacyl-[acyl-carrier-protein] synthase family protein [Candidatus Scalindua rubra]|uniref:3-oxoacyl-(Acyl-carrier-protein) synthase n=1 Tax=Candidatus Scalindua brodae TaxID=237368 RepID=A0A0B0EG41_9BACT|nr:MAG: 3-oxoacyl-(acyl-carrier-protein) synthase [Candidatus Scalindua brodae]MBZ0107704.1 beta-ketoacyl-[acyl-carrier-protein] synthase family protein [Candidatus Scalindua rubra]TWU35538.1 3-oxoacyl-[acyl-carrier-protein] synthase 2 [Candidatus Brocadiaceae bacterium S225]